jgi:multiple sugar transport system permease protein
MRTTVLVPPGEPSVETPGMELSKSAAKYAQRKALRPYLILPAAYALARFHFRLKEDIAFTILSFRFAPEILVILPLFLIYQRTGLYDTYFGLIWVYQLITLPLLIWILRGYFEDISPDIEAAAQLDGYSWWQVFLKVLLPLVKPGLVAAGLLCFIFAWNAFTFPLLLLDARAQTSTVVALRFLASVSLIRSSSLSSAQREPGKLRP